MNTFTQATLIIVCIVALWSYLIPFLRDNVLLDQRTVDLVVVNARRHHIWTGVDSNEFVEAFAIENGRFVAVGSTEHVMQRVGKAKIQRLVDLSDKDKRHWFIIPGLHDAHVHLILGGRSLTGVQLRHVKDKESFIEQVERFVEKKRSKGLLNSGDWILGAEWNEVHYPDAQMPHKSWLDPILPDNPAYLIRMDVHSCVVNSKALELANITKDTPNMDGGFIEKDPITGEPTGILKDRAMELIQKIVPPVNDTEAMINAMDQIAANGITAVAHMGPGPFAVEGESWTEFELFKRLRDEGVLKIRIHTAMELGLWKKLADYIQMHGSGDEWLTYGSLKTFFDGSLGSLTALMLDPFEGTNNAGLQTIDSDQFYEVCKRAEENSLQMITHAIGDKANRMVLDIYEKVFQESSKTYADRRFRVEHTQHLHHEDIARFSKLGVVASVQPCHLIEDAVTAESVLGTERVKELYAFRSLLETQKQTPLLALGTDWFVAELDPISNIYAAVTRKAPSHPDGFNPSERITVRDALKAYTFGSAYASFNEHRMGVIAEGYLGDVTILSQNLLEIPEDDIPKTTIVATIVGGSETFNAVRDEKIQ